MKTAEVASLNEVLQQYTREGELYERLPGEQVRCFACGHRCLILEGRLGVCKVRFNRGGRLLVPHGYVGALQCDPVEKKPFFHALPGSLAFSFGMLGCDYHCAYCQNWLTSQTLRDPQAMSQPQSMSAERTVELAKRYGARIIASTYNEPLITSEWAVEIFRLAKEAGLRTAYISNGNATPQVLDYLHPWVDLYKVDLKGFNDRNYRRLGGQLRVVLEAIELLVKKGFWVEVVTLVVPGLNDSPQELGEIARFLCAVSQDLPWHVTAFHPDYKMDDRGATPVRALLRAVEIGRQAGLHFVYAGNLSGAVAEHENTYCPACHTLLIQRHGFRILGNLLQAGACPRCHTSIPGVWN